MLYRLPAYAFYLQVSMTRKCLNHKLQTDPQHPGEETQTTDSHNTIKVKQQSLSLSLSLSLSARQYLNQKGPKSKITKQGEQQQRFHHPLSI